LQGSEKEKTKGGAEEDHERKVEVGKGSREKINGGG